MKNLWKRILGAVIVLCVVALLAMSAYSLPEGHVAAIYRFGKLDKIEQTAGVHFKFPLVSSVKRIDIREQSEDITQNAYTRDTQVVELLETKVNYRLNIAMLEDIIRETGIDTVYDKLILPKVLSTTKNYFGQYTADAIVAQRAEVERVIQEDITNELQERGIMVMSFDIKNIDFDDAYESAVKAKVEAEQQALRAQNQTKEKEELAKQQVIAAQAEADAAKLRADAEAYSIESINGQLQASPQYIEYLKITRWDGKLPAVQGEATPIIDLRTDPQAATASAPAATPTTRPTPTPTPEPTPDPAALEEEN